MKFKQITASILLLILGGTALTQTYHNAIANDNTTQSHATASFNNEHRQTARQVASLLDRSHYLDKKLDVATGKQILSAYFDMLDPNHTLFLQSDIDEFEKKYAENFSQYLKRGELSAGFAIYQRFRQRSQAYYEFAEKFLKSPINLKRNDSIILNREKQPFFANAEQQQLYWEQQLTFQLMNMTINQEEEKAKEKIFEENPDKYQAQDLIKNEQRSPNEILASRLKRQFGQLERTNSDQIMEYILNAAMNVYDPHSNYFAPVQANEIQIQNSLELVGIGVSIQPDRKNPDYTRIMTLVDGGPASKSGQIKPNDLIIGVAEDGKKMVDTVGYSTREVVSLIRGSKGTPVTIRVKSPNSPDSSARNVTLIRDLIRQDDVGVSHRVIHVKDSQGKDKRIGVIEIPSFYINYKARRKGESYRSVSIDTANAIQALNQQNIDGLVVDLRDDPGGSLDEVTRMLDMFIKKGPFVQIRDNRGNIQIYQDNDNGEQLYQGKMAVLINLASASASEIFAAAIQDYGRGIVVGNTTSGKGSAQIQLDNLAMGSATLTQRKFYRITGGSTQNKGVEPDVKLVNIYKGLDIGERSQKNPLKWDTIRTSPFLPEGTYSKAHIKHLNEQSKKRQDNDPQFIYLSTLNQIRDVDSDKKPIKLDIDDRRQYLQSIEQRTLKAVNARQKATGKPTYRDWNDYQASLDVEFETRSRMKQNERPKLPESEAYIIETAKILLDAKH